MRQLLLFFLTILSFNSYAQKNQLLYDKQTINQLRKTADSLNTLFSKQHNDSEFYSLEYATGEALDIELENTDDLNTDLSNNLTFLQFINKYPQARTSNNIILQRFDFFNDKKELIKSFRNYEKEGDLHLWLFPLKEYSTEERYVSRFGKNDTSPVTYYTSIFFFRTPFTKKKIPAKYSKMIAYADYMMDTQTSKIKKGAKLGEINKELPLNWTELPKSQKLLLLDELRSVSPIPFCVVDDQIDLDILNMALLAANTNSWDVFLKAHLSLVFERFYINNSFYKHSSTSPIYIRELELINVNTVDLLLGIMFSIDNPVENHYHVSSQSFGSVIIESQYQEEFKKELFEIIANEELDDINRLRFASIYIHYITAFKSQTDRQVRTNEFLQYIDKAIPLYANNIRLEVQKQLK